MVENDVNFCLKLFKMLEVGDILNYFIIIGNVFDLVVYFG